VTIEAVQVTAVPARTAKLSAAPSGGADAANAPDGAKRSAANATLADRIEYLHFIFESPCPAALPCGVAGRVFSPSPDGKPLQTLWRLPKVQAGCQQVLAPGTLEFWAEDEYTATSVEGSSASP
jgi:hypothetical protein